MIKKIWDWLTVSSADPSQLSATVKGILGTAASVLLLLSPVTHLYLSNAQVSNITDITIQIVLAFCAVISSIGAILGLARKIYLAIKFPTVKPQV